MADATQIHTHLCYSEFGEVIDAIDALDADVTSIEAARSHMEVLGDLTAAGFAHSVGPGVYDIHSPRVPGVDEMAGVAARGAESVPAERLWVNPDCGLKTRARRGDGVAAAPGRRGQGGPRRLAHTIETPAARNASTASAVVVGDTPAVRSSSTRVVKPAAAASAAVAFTQ